VKLPVIASIILAAAVLVGCGRDPESQKTRFVELGNKYFEQEDYHEASIFYRKALQYDRRYAEAYYRLGLTDLETEDYGSAFAALRRAYELDPSNLDAFSKLGELYLTLLSGPIPANREAMLNELIGLSERGEQDHPGTFEVLYVKGGILTLQQDYDAAIDVLDDALLLRPDHARATLGVAMAHYAMGRTGQGEAMALELLEKEMSDEDKRRVLGFLYRTYVITRRAGDALKILLKRRESFPEDPQSWLLLAALHYSTGYPERADEAINEMLREIEDDPSVYLHASDFYTSINRPEQAIQFLREGAGRDPDQELMCKVRIAGIYATMNDSEKAYAELEEVLSEDPENAEALGVRGLVRLYSRDPGLQEGALSDLQSAVSKMPENYRLRSLYGRALAHSGDSLGAETQFEEALRLNPGYPPAYRSQLQLVLNRGEYPRAKAMANQLLEFHPADDALRLGLGMAHRGLREGAEARAIFTDLKNRGLYERESTYQMALLELAEKNHAAAESRFRELGELDPPDPRGTYGLIQVLVSQRRFKEALAHTDSVLSGQPGRTDLKLRAAQISLAGRDAEQAAEYLAEVVEDDPGNVTAHLILSRVMMANGDRESAKVHLLRATQGTPPLAEAFYAYGSMLAAEGRFRESREQFERCLELQPDHANALNNLAFVMAETDADLDQAVTYAQRAIARDPKNHEYGDTLAYIYIKRNLYQDAVNVLTPIVRDSPDRADYRYHLALALYRNGDEGRARAEFNRIDLDRLQPADAQRVRELLSEIGG